MRRLFVASLLTGCCFGREPPKVVQSVCVCVYMCVQCFYTFLFVFLFFARRFPAALVLIVDSPFNRKVDCMSCFLAKYKPQNIHKMSISAIYI